MRGESIPHETPWLAVYCAEKNALGLQDKQAYATWLPTQFADGDRVMILALPLVYDHPGYHAAAFRFYWNAILPIVAEDLGEANLEQAHDILAKQFVGVTAAPKKKRGLKLKRKSTAMNSMSCATFCDYLDRLIVWAATDRGLILPMANRRWKQERRGAGTDPGVESGHRVHVAAGTADGEYPSTASGAER